jgi:hypothetical protein
VGKGRSLDGWFRDEPSVTLGSIFSVIRFLSPLPMTNSQFQSICSKTSRMEPATNYAVNSGEGKVVHDAPAVTAVKGDSE